MKESSVPPTHAEKKRAQIRAAATQLFLLHGFQATSTDAIAAAAAISKETLYHYYPKKEDLFIDVLRSLTVGRPVWVQLLERSTEPQTTEELRALLRTTAQGLWETMLQPEYLAILRLIVAESPRFPELGTLFREAVPAQGITYCLALLRSGQSSGLVRQDIDPSIVARMFLGTLLTHTLLDGLTLNTQVARMPDPDAIDALVDHLMDLISVSSTRA